MQARVVGMFDNLIKAADMPSRFISIPIPDDEKDMKCEICGKARLNFIDGLVFQTNGKKVWTCSFLHFHDYREGQRAP
jgi:alpha-D-ribose 1-methylphosphonate 5-phosphate C-P lyase